MSIRNSAKALIIRGDKILINKNKNTLGEMCYGLPNGAIYYDLPGGGQNQYETLEEAVVRECLEETGYAITVDRLAAIYEEITINDEFRRQYEEYAHKVHFVFMCHLNEMTASKITELDLDMLGSEWVRIEDMSDIPLYPVTIKTNLKTVLYTDSPLYLGHERVK